MNVPGQGGRLPYCLQSGPDVQARMSDKLKFIGHCGEKMSDKLKFVVDNWRASVFLIGSITEARQL